MTSGGKRNAVAYYSTGSIVHLILLHFGEEEELFLWVTTDWKGILTEAQLGACHIGK